MPGIVGLITKMPRERAEAQLRSMLDTIRHEPWYTTGTWVDESLGVYVGWAVRGGSFCDGMPLINEQGDVALVFSGEEYPDPATISTLKRQGRELGTQRASYLVHLCEADPMFPAGLNGRFQGICIDRRVGKATLFNDRSGMDRVYYHESKDAFYFAVEAKAILAVRSDLRRLDPRGLGEYVSCGCVLENRTLFDGIKLLPPGSSWEFRNGALEQRRAYFGPSDWEEQVELDQDTYYEALRNTFEKTLPRYFNGGGPIGMSVTGGLDTRMIMAWWKASPESIPCYSFAGTYRDSHDVVLGKKLAHAWGQTHERIEVGQDFLSRFPRYAERTVHLTDGSADVSSSPVLYTNELVRGIAPTRMTGNYGGEVLRGSRMFKPQDRLTGLFSSDLATHIAQTRSTYAALSKAHPVTFALSRQVPWYHHGQYALEGTQLSVRSPFLDNDLVRTAYRAPKAVFADGEVCLRLIADGNPRMRQIRTDRGIGKNGVLGALERAFHEFTFKAEYAYNHGMPPWLARVDRVLSPLRPERLFLGRHKYSHFRIWYRDHLSKYVQEMLLDPRSLNRWYINKTIVEQVVTKHVSGEGNYTFEIHKLLSLELLNRTLLDRG
jgi:asparagine synthase (glutamine-hydrolysing)